MKTFNLTFCTLLISHQLWAASLTVKVSNPETLEKKGQLVVLVFNNDDGFPFEKELRKEKQDIGSLTSFNFSNLPPGEYAVMAYHDKNENGKLDRNWIGMPREKVSLSNRKLGEKGRPRFKKAKFQILEKENKEIVLHMQVPKK